jgi:hypothetical protein
MINARSFLYAFIFGGLLIGGLAQLGSAVGSDDIDHDDDDSVAITGAAPPNEKVQSTPVVMRVDNVPIPVKGADDRYHVVYELTLENFTGDTVAVDRLEVRAARTGVIVATLEAAEIGKRLVVRDRSIVPGTMAASQVGILYVHLIFERRDDIPRVLDHRLTVISSKSEANSAAVARIRVARPTELVLDAPLHGDRFIAGDGCCDSVRHIRATLALNGGAFTAQRFAIDWEQLDEQGRIYVGDRQKPESYIIYGKPAYAVANGRVIAAVDGMADSPIGVLPDTPVDQADGNHVVLDLGDGRYALYAHFKPHSVRVHKGEFVQRGQVLGLVGTSGNSSEPHLHFHVTDGPSPLMSNGVPYLLRHFTSQRKAVSTEAFDQATVNGLPIDTEPVPDPGRQHHVLPLDLWIMDFKE